MKKNIRSLILSTLFILLALAAGIFFLVLPGYVEQQRNAVQVAGPYTAGSAASALHARLLVADLHADSLLWSRDLLERGGRGQVDIPRLIEGNVALQGFTIVTKSPRNMNIEHNTGDTDNITLLAIAQRWPAKSWGSLAERALFQARKLDDVAQRSGGRFSLIRSGAELDAYLQRRKATPAITAGFLGVEGAHALDGNLDNIDRFFEAGIRMMAPTHFFDNDIGGSAHGETKGGLSDKGRDMIRRMEAKKMLLDLAHASPQTISDALAMATRPIVISHTGVKGTCDNARNLSDDQLRAIAKNGGVVGIGYWSTAICGDNPAAVARAIGYAVSVAGIDHVALGSDYDGSVAVPFDTSGLVMVTEALQKQGMKEEDIAKVMGGNTFRLMKASLP